MSKQITIDAKHNKTRSRSIDCALQYNIEWMKEFGIKTPCAQIFVTGPRDFDETLSENDKINTRAVVDSNGLILVIHGAYVDNPWNNSARSIHNIKQEMKIAQKIGATGVIIHLGASASNNLYHVLSEINKSAHEYPDVILWLEINAAKPNELTFETPEKIIALFNKVDKTLKLKVGLCIDTAHLHSCGVSLQTYDSAAKWFSAIMQIAPYIMLHLNDSASIAGSGIDRHAELCVGNIWRDYHPGQGELSFNESGLAYILQWVKENNIVTILERDHEGAQRDMLLLQSIGYF